MFKNFLLILITTIALASVTGCSLFSSDSEEQDTAVAEEEVSEDVGEDIGEDVEGTTEETTSTDEEATTETAATSEEDEEEVVDEYPDDDYGDEEETAVAKEDEFEKPQKEEETLYVDRSEETPAEEPSTYSESTEPIQDSYDGGGSASGMVSVKKMKKTPYMASGALINRLYIARDGDSLRTVAEKVYGDGSRSKDLVSWNSNFRGKDLKVGDKVYYSSARNPQDNSAILLYYEESGVQPSYHTAKSGESIRRVSQKLLGHESSWKEVWATNEVESKWEMPEGTQLRYWPAGTVAAPVQTQASAKDSSPEPTQPEEEAMPMEEATTTEVAANDAPPMEESQPMEEPPPMDDGTAAGMAQNENAPPPPPSEATPPPPPPPEAIPTPEANNMAQEGTEGGGLSDMMGGENDSMMMAILGGLLLLAAMILVVFIRRGRKKAYG